MILVDTSVWINHFRRTDSKLVFLLQNDGVLIHPLIIGEIACGHLKNRSEILDLLMRLPKTLIATDEEVLAFIEHQKLFGKGLGFIDIHLLASAKMTKVKLWTFDQLLHK